MGVTIMTLAVGNDIDRKELLKISSSEDYVFLVEGYDKLVSSIEKISNASCYTRRYFVGAVGY